MSGRVTLITGASRGIGRAAAVELARRGHAVVATARSTKALEALHDEVKGEGGEIAILPLDLTDRKAVAGLGPALQQRYGRLDGLLANAGDLGTLGPLQAQGERAFDTCLSVNLTANFHLLRTLHAPLSESEAPRVVFVSSGASVRPRAFWGMYAASKAGLDAMALCYADEVESLGFRVNLFDPGATATGMRAEAMPGEDPSGLPSPAEVAAHIAPLLEASERRHGERVSARALLAS